MNLNGTESDNNCRIDKFRSQSFGVPALATATSVPYGALNRLLRAYAQR